MEDFQMTQEELGRQVGRTRAHVSNTVRLLGLGPAVQAALVAQAISAGHARALSKLPAETQAEALRRVLREELNVRQTELLAQSLAHRAGGPPRRRQRLQQDAQTMELEARFRDALQARVTLQRRRKGGRLVVDFYSDEELNDLYRRIVEPSSSSFRPDAGPGDVNPDGETP